MPQHFLFSSKMISEITDLCHLTTEHKWTSEGKVSTEENTDKLLANDQNCEEKHGGEGLYRFNESKGTKHCV